MTEEVETIETADEQDVHDPQGAHIVIEGLRCEFHGVTGEHLTWINHQDGKPVKPQWVLCPESAPRKVLTESSLRAIVEHAVGLVVDVDIDEHVPLSTKTKISEEVWDILMDVGT